MIRTMIIYGVALSGTATFLEWLDFRHSVRDLNSSAFLAILAVVFIAFGIWLGRRLFSLQAVAGLSPNEPALRYLGISRREHDVLANLAAGHSNKVIARLMGISPNTVKTHVSSVLAKLEVNSRTQAIRKARELRLLS